MTCACLRHSSLTTLHPAERTHSFPNRLRLNTAVQFNRFYPPCCRTADKILFVSLMQFRTYFLAPLLFVASTNVLGFGGTSWSEEVLLHDGSKIIVKRSQSYGGSHEIGQTPPIKEQDITFTVPGSSKSITWKSEYGEDIGRSNFNPVALHILHGVPYIVAVPNLCQSYNKWGRPNPPYVFFKYEGKLWQRILLSDLPMEFKDINLVVNSKGEEKIITAQSVVTAQLIKKLNGELDQPEYRRLLREPLVRENCPQYSSSPKAPIAVPRNTPK